jgi:RNA polymerase sigma-70 factor (ECF subfamily)
MTSKPQRQVTQLLQDWRRGDRAALDALMPLVEAELHRLARAYMARERAGHTLQPTALVNEAYMRLIGERNMEWQSRAHFIGVAAQLMRFILVDHSRKKRSGKRGGLAQQVTLDDGHAVDLPAGADVLALDQALKRLETVDARKSRIAELRFFGGLNVEETAEAMSLSEATIHREWRLARAFLQRELA